MRLRPLTVSVICPGRRVATTAYVERKGMRIGDPFFFFGFFLVFFLWFPLSFFLSPLASVLLATLQVSRAFSQNDKDRRWVK